MISNGQEGYGGPRQLMDRPWEEQTMQDAPGRRSQPQSQQHGRPMQNGTNILAAVGQQVCTYQHRPSSVTCHAVWVHFWMHDMLNTDLSYITSVLMHINISRYQSKIAGQHSCWHAFADRSLLCRRVCHMGTKEL